MSLGSHLEQLKQKHGEVENKLQDALKHPSTRDDEIAELKRQKLVLKDKIEALNS